MDSGAFWVEIKFKGENKMKKIKLKNKFHDTECHVMGKFYPIRGSFCISKRSVRNAKNKLCGSDDCQCDKITKAIVDDKIMEFQPLVDGGMEFYHR